MGSPKTLARPMQAFLSIRMLRARATRRLAVHRRTSSGASLAIAVTFPPKTMTVQN